MQKRSKRSTTSQQLQRHYFPYFIPSMIQASLSIRFQFCINELMGLSLPFFITQT
jgi:hypothetical protein